MVLSAKVRPPRRLDELKRGVKEILTFLEAERVSQVTAALKYLEQAFQTITKGEFPTVFRLHRRCRELPLAPETRTELSIERHRRSMFIPSTVLLDYFPNRRGTTVAMHHDSEEVLAAGAARKSNTRR